MATIQKITSHLWFDRNGEEAARFYTSIFKNSSIGYIARYGKAGFEQHQMPEGTVMTVEFTIEGQQFLALNGGPHFKFSEAISFVVVGSGVRGEVMQDTGFWIPDTGYWMEFNGCVAFSISYDGYLISLN